MLPLSLAMAMAARSASQPQRRCQLLTPCPGPPASRDPSRQQRYAHKTRTSSGRSWSANGSHLPAPLRHPGGATASPPFVPARASTWLHTTFLEEAGGQSLEARRGLIRAWREPTPALVQLLSILENKTTICCTHCADWSQTTLPTRFFLSRPTLGPAGFNHLRFLGRPPAASKRCATVLSVSLRSDYPRHVARRRHPAILWQGSPPRRSAGCPQLRLGFSMVGDGCAWCLPHHDFVAVRDLPCARSASSLLLDKAHPRMSPL